MPQHLNECKHPTTRLKTKTPVTVTTRVQKQQTLKDIQCEKIVARQTSINKLMNYTKDSNVQFFLANILIFCCDTKLELCLTEKGRDVVLLRHDTMITCMNNIKR